MCVLVLATLCARALLKHTALFKQAPLKRGRMPSRTRERAQGRPGARCTRGLACKQTTKNAHEHTGSAEAVRPSLRNGFTTYNVLSLATGFLVTIASRDAKLLENLTPAPGRQDHTTSPSTSRAVRQKRIGVHRIPPHVRDDRETPLVWDGIARNKPVICVGCEADYFFDGNWTGQISLIRHDKSGFRRIDFWPVPIIVKIS